MAISNRLELEYRKSTNKKKKRTIQLVAYFKIFSQLHTTMEQAWVKKLRILSFMKNIAKPPAMAGSGINVQNDEWPKILLD